jgi:hypothetical protein
MAFGADRSADHRSHFVVRGPDVPVMPKAETGSGERRGGRQGRRRPGRAMAGPVPDATTRRRGIRMTVTANLDKLLDKKFEDLDLHALPNAPVDALAGVSKADAEALAKAFDVKTIGDLGRNPYIKAAVSITSLADASN